MLHSSLGSHSSLCCSIGVSEREAETSSPLPGHLLPYRDHCWGCLVPGVHLVLQAELCGVSCCPMLSDEHCAQPPSHDSPTCPALNTPVMNPKGSR